MFVYFKHKLLEYDVLFKIMTDFSVNYQYTE